jgi:hypothetical protein
VLHTDGSPWGGCLRGGNRQRTLLDRETAVPRRRSSAATNKPPAGRAPEPQPRPRTPPTTSGRA